MLTESQQQRYSRQILLPDVGGRGQQRLLDACVRISPGDPGGLACAMWLARSGVGHLLLPDEQISKGRKEWLRATHAPDLSFEGTEEVRAPFSFGPKDGARAALIVIRQLLGAA